MKINPTFGHLPNRSIYDIYSSDASSLKRFYCLWVAIDSSRGEDISKVYDSQLSKTRWLSDYPEKFQIKVPGLLIAPDVLFRIQEEENWVVPFSALYIFKKKPLDKVLANELYNFTSETIDFSDSIPSELIDALKESLALGYMADGCGLSYCFTSRIALKAVIPDICV